MPDSQRFIKRLESVYARVVVAATVLLITLPPFVLDWSWSDTFYKAMVFLVVASPCALVSSIMPAMLSAISKSARKGILFKGGVHLENMARTSVVAFDKTGTLTEGIPQVTDFIAGEGYVREELLAVSASIEKLSGHPLAEAIVALAEAEQIGLRDIEESQSVTGWGIEGIRTASCGGSASPICWMKRKGRLPGRLRTIGRLCAAVWNRKAKRYR